MHKAIDRALPIIQHGFETECRAHGGVTTETAEDVVIFRRMLRASGEQFRAATCLDPAQSILAAKIIITARYIGAYKRTGVYIMQGGVANPAYAATVAAIVAENSATERGKPSIGSPLNGIQGAKQKQASAWHNGNRRLPSAMPRTAVM